MTLTDIRNTLAPIWHTKARTAKKVLNRLNLFLKHVATLGLDVDLQATEKVRAFLGKQRHKTIKSPPMDEKGRMVWCEVIPLLCSFLRLNFMQSATPLRVYKHNLHL
ncbi:hypothetical protein [Bartonella harrusi]|uniref:Integrase SAM-like N-terminal domain-containing protein n=1 Tax=Bartonella harrusi TaxID=2961895 RepID=A0ABY5EVV3_9HYPH|nr:hypothetical protein [Bartonella harrusi]UTO28555.1 hypothetical protein NMK50_00480 [Bartonella harrusi]